MDVADGHQISTGAISGSADVATVEPQSSVILNAALFGYQCDQSGKSIGAGEMQMLPAGEYTFVPTILITPERALPAIPPTCTGRS